MSVIAIVVTLFCGCGQDVKELKGRVALNVTVQVGGSPASEGTLILRPDPGIACPLIQVPISEGTGELPEEQGPVPGGYTATFRSAESDLSAQLSEDGERQAPTAAGRAGVPSPRQRRKTVPVPAGTSPVTIPDQNPATVTVSFAAAP
ncbi:MAG: hypothetical protein KDA89_08640 [Planctomycetaceae bacterium]|nr:hypothetical protein [Planctomycetaceae bacterium]